MGAETDVMPWPAAKDPGLDATSFVANGHEYRIGNSISVARYEEYEILGIEGGLARNFEQVHGQHVKLLGLLNKMARGEDALAQMAIITNDLVTGGFLLKAREIHPALKMCALFINRKDEDISVITDEMIAEKVNDWRIEGISINYFFAFAFHLIPGYIAAYKANSPATSGPVKGNQNPNGKKGMKDSSTASDGIAHGQNSNA